MAVSKRWEVIYFLFTAATVSYMLRVNICVCAQKMRDEFDWTDMQKGLVLSAFFWGYAIGQIPSSICADKLGGKFTLGFAIVSSSVLTLLVPLASRTSFTLTLIARAATGLSQAATFPSCFYFYARWIPVKDGVLMISFVLGGMYLGEMIGFGLSGALVAVDYNIGSLTIKGWEMVFYSFGLVGIVLWFPLFYLRVYDNPDDHPYCSEEETLLIKTGNCFYDPLLMLNSVDEEVESDLDSTPLLSDVAKVYSRSSSLSRRSKSRSITEAVVSETNHAPTSEGFLGMDQEVKVSFCDDVHPAKGEFGEEFIDVKVSNRDFFSKPWFHIFTHPASVTLMLSYWTFGWIGYMVLTEMPSYLNDELGFDLSTSGLLSVLPYACNFLAVIASGHFFDYLQRERSWSNRDVRQWANRISFIGASGSLILSGYMMNPIVAFVFMNVGLSFFGFITSGVHCSFIEVSPNFSSTMNTVGNMVGAIAGIVGPLVVSVFLVVFENRSRLAWQMVFYVTAGFAALSLIHWNYYQTSEVVPLLNNPVKRKL